MFLVDNSTDIPSKVENIVKGETVRADIRGLTREPKCGQRLSAGLKISESIGIRG